MKNFFLIGILTFCYGISFCATAIKKSLISDPVITIANNEQTIEVSPIPPHGILNTKVIVNFVCSKKTTRDISVNLVITGGNTALNPLFVPADASLSGVNTITIIIPKGKTSFDAHLVISYKATDIKIPVQAYISQVNKPENSLALNFIAKKDLPTLKSDIIITLKNETNTINTMQNAGNGNFHTESVVLTFICSKQLTADTTITLYLEGDGSNIKPLFVTQPPANQTSDTYIIKIPKGTKDNYMTNILLNYQAPGNEIPEPTIAYISIKDKPDKLVTIKFISKMSAIVAGAPLKSLNTGKGDKSIKTASLTIQPDITLVSDTHIFTLSKNTSGNDATATESIEIKFKCSAVLPADQEVTLYIEGSAGNSLPLFITGLQSAITGNSTIIKVPKGYIAYTTSVLVNYHLPTSTLTNAVAYISVKDKPAELLTLKFTNTDATLPANATITPTSTVTSASTTAAPVGTGVPASTSTPATPAPTVTLIKNEHSLPIMKTLNNDPSFTDTVSLFFKAKTKITDGSPVNITLIMQGDANGVKPLFLADASAINTATTLAAKIDSKMYFGDDKADNLPVYKLQVRYAYTTLKNGLTDPATAFVTVKDDPANIVTLKFTNLVEVTRANPFWVEVGANFDLLDGISANNLYTGIMAFEKDISHLKFGNRTVDISYTGGVYESKSTTLSNSSDSGLVYRDGRSYTAITGKGYPYFRDTGTYVTTTTVQSVGLFFSPHFKLSDIATSSNGFHAYFSLYAEMLWQRVKSKYDFSKTTNIQTLYETDLSNIYMHSYKENEVNMDFRSHYFGVGLPMYIVDNDYSIYINSVAGFSNQKFALVQEIQGHNYSGYQSSYLIDQYKDNNPFLAGYLTPKSRWNPFYIVQFRLTSEKYGVSFTGEIRGLMLNQNKPIISLSLSKKFDPGHLFSSLFTKSN